MSRWSTPWPWAALALAGWIGGVAIQRQRERPPEAVLAPWQHSFRELPADEQRVFRHLREALVELEHARVTEGAWPSAEALKTIGVEPFREDELTAPRTWSVATQGVYTSYVGLPVEPSALRWLVLFIEPSTNEPAPPEDEEHHTLLDGTPVHVTVWTQPNTEPPVTGEVLAFPAAEGWSQRVGR